MTYRMSSTKLWFVIYAMLDSTARHQRRGEAFTHVAIATTAKPIREARRTRHPNCSLIGIRILTMALPAKHVSLPARGDSEAGQRRLLWRTAARSVSSGGRAVAAGQAERRREATRACLAHLFPFLAPRSGGSSRDGFAGSFARDLRLWVRCDRCRQAPRW